MSSNQHTLAESNHMVLNSDSERPRKDSVKCSNVQEMNERKVEPLDKGFTEQHNDVSNQDTGKKLKSKQPPTAIIRSLQAMEPCPSLDYSSPTEQEVVIGEAQEVPKAERVMDEGDEFMQPVVEEESRDSTYSTAQESPGLSLSRFRINDTALTLITDFKRLLNTLVTSNCCQVDESCGHPEGLDAARDPVEDLGVTRHLPLPHSPTEPSPGTEIDVVAIENAFPSGEPGFHLDSEPITPVDGELCSICLESQGRCAFCPCGHYACSPCIDRWTETLRPSTPKCHICRQDVEDLVTF